MLRNIWCFGHIWKLQIIAEENNKTAAILPIFFHISWTPHVPWSKRSLPLGPRHWLKIGTPSIPGRLPARRVQRPRGAARKGAAPGRCGKMWENVVRILQPPPKKKLEGYRLRMFKGFSRISVVDFYFRVQTWSLGLLVLWSMVCWIRWIGATNQDHLRWSSDLSAVILILSYLWKWLDQNKHIIRGKLLFEQMEK